MALIVLARQKPESGLKLGGLNPTLEVVLTRRSHSESPGSNTLLFLWGGNKKQADPELSPCASVTLESCRSAALIATPPTTTTTSCSI